MIKEKVKIMNLNPFKKEMSLDRREDWSFTLWCIIIINLIVSYYLLTIESSLLLLSIITFFILLKFAITNNKIGLEMKKKQKKSEK